MNALLAFAWPFSADVSERLGWVLVHSLWQFALLALVASAAVRAMRRNAAKARYSVLVSAMGMSVAIPVATWLLRPSDASDDSVSRAAAASAHEQNSAAGPTAEGPPLDSPRLVSDTGFNVSTPELAASSVACEARSEASGHTRAGRTPAPYWRARAETVLRPWLTWIVVGWSIGVVLCSARPLLGWHTLRRLHRVGVSGVSDEVLDALARVSQRLGVRRVVRVLNSTVAHVPIVIGYLRPVILLPVSLITSIPAAQLEAILAHELAHVRRHDFVVNLLQTVVETLFFYHPAVWWLSRQIRVEREHCCDDVVVALLGNRVEYGRALVAIEQLRGGSTVLALGARDGSMLSRVRRIAGVAAAPPTFSLVDRWPLALIGVACLGVVLAFWMSWNLAAKDDGEGDAPLTIRARAVEEQARKPQDKPPDESGAAKPAPITRPVEENRAERRSEDLFARPVALTARAMPLKEALAAVARAATLELQLEVDALQKAGLDVEQPVTVTIKDEPLAEALGRLIPRGDEYQVLRQLRGGKLVITTLQAHQEYTQRHLPEWLKPLYNRGLLAQLDDDHNVVSITAGEVVTDALLARFKTLPKLRELHVETTKTLTPAGLVHLADLSALEKLSLYSLSYDGKGLGDAAIEQIVGLKSLRELSLGTCGTTDAGVRRLEGMPQLRRLSLNGEGLLTDTALGSIATLKRLQLLSLSSYVATEKLGRMRFTEDAIRRLAKLEELEELHLVGHPVPADVLAFPRLKALSLGLAGMDDACAGRIAQLRHLESLDLVYTNITDEGLKKIAGLPALSRLNLDSHLVTDEGIGHLKRLATLEHLSLRASRLNDESLRHVAEMKRLKRVDLHGSGQPGAEVGRRFSIAAVQGLKALPDLRTLWLSNVASAGGYLGLKELAQLRELSLMMTNIREDELEALEEALPNTTIHAATGGGFARTPKARRASKAVPTAP